MVRRVYVEKKPSFAVQAKDLRHEIRHYLNIAGCEDVRVFIRYDVENISDEVFEQAAVCVFSEPPVDRIYFEKLPEADLLIANLLIEYIGYEAFQKTVSKVQPKYCSCVIQINTDTKQWVSDSPYLHAFDRLDEVHHQMEEDALEKAMKEIGYSLIHRSIETLPNGKALVRMDFSVEKVYTHDLLITYFN